MRLDYGTQISPYPVVLSDVTIKKPTLADIAKISFDKFSYYESFLKLTPEMFFTKIKQNGSDYWESLTTEQRKEITLYNIIKKDKTIQDIYVELLNFFCMETILYKNGYFVVLKIQKEKEDDADSYDVQGAIAEDKFCQILSILRQICCIDEKENTDNLKYKNNLAKKLLQRMKANQKKEKTKSDINMTIPNIISAVSSKHPSLNYSNIWNLTIFQLLDAFSRIQVNSMYEIDSTRVSVWGDEKKTFDHTLWFKNEYDKR